LDGSQIDDSLGKNKNLNPIPPHLNGEKLGIVPFIPANTEWQSMSLSKNQDIIF
jgi:hypothetical protein